MAPTSAYPQAPFAIPLFKIFVYRTTLHYSAGAHIVQGLPRSAGNSGAKLPMASCCKPSGCPWVHACVCLLTRRHRLRPEAGPRPSAFSVCQQNSVVQPNSSQHPLLCPAHSHGEPDADSRPPRSARDMREELMPEHPPPRRQYRCPGRRVSTEECNVRPRWMAEASSDNRGQPSPNCPGFASGLPVTVHGLQSRPELNGAYAFVDSWHGSSQ